MYCPNCSAEASTDQKYCRGCGMQLQAVAQLVRSQGDLSTPERAPQTDPGRQPTMLLWGRFIMLASVALGASIKLLGKEGARPAGDWTPFIGVALLLAVLIGMGMICYPLLAPKIKAAGARTRLSANRTYGGDLPEVPFPIGEHTTELFEGSALRSDERNTAPRS